MKLYIKEIKSRQRKKLMTPKAKELFSDYNAGKELTTFTELDGEDSLFNLSYETS